jgi:branched-chain amino acid transport system permease protein
MDYVLSVLTLLAIYAVLASSLNIVLGHGGLLSLCHAAFYAIGAYTAALTALHLGWSYLPAAAAAIAVAAIFAGVLAIPLLKLRGDYFILGSLGFQIIIIDAIYNSDAITNGPLGISRIPRPEILGFEFRSHVGYFVLYACLAAIAVAVLHFLAASPFGRTLAAVREDEMAATVLGKNIRSVRIRAFAISAGGAGRAGAMYANYVTFIDPTSFGFGESVYILSLVVVGGVATTRGPLLGATLLVIAPELLRFIGFSSSMDANLRQLLYGLLLIIFAMTRPSGIAGKNVF